MRDTDYAHPKSEPRQFKKRLRELYGRTLDPSGLLAEIRDTADRSLTRTSMPAPARSRQNNSMCTDHQHTDTAAVCKGAWQNVFCGEQRAIHQQTAQTLQETVSHAIHARIQHIEDIERWLAAEPHLTALFILGRLGERCPSVRAAATYHRAASAEGTAKEGRRPS